MDQKNYDTVIIGGGAAGMAAAVSVSEEGLSAAIIDREDTLGGILLQCIHNGFGLHYFKEELTGPEYAERFINMVNEKKISVYTNTTVMDIMDATDGKSVITYSSKQKALRLNSRAIVMAMGCRERNRGNIGIAGTRPSGVLTAGLAQRLLNIDGLIPGENAVIIGSGDIGLIMARRLSWTGCKVHAVVEIQPYPSGIARNIVQCLNDFKIPLYLNHVVSNIHGKNRVEGVTITPLVDGEMNSEKSFFVECDTILLSVGLIPDIELMKKLSIAINHDTGGPIVDCSLMTDVDGIFACGNVLHVHDLVDYLTEESYRCGKYVSRYLSSGKNESQFNIKPGANIRYVVPNKYSSGMDNPLYFRSMIVKNDAVMTITSQDQVLVEKKMKHVQPSEMCSFILKKDVLDKFFEEKGSEIFISIK